MQQPAVCENCGAPLNIPPDAGRFALRLRVCGPCGDGKREDALHAAVDARMAAWDRHVADWLAASGLPSGDAERTLDNYAPTTAAEIAAFCVARDWLDAFDPQHPERSRWLVFVGKSNGTGKSHLVEAMLRAVVARCVPLRADVERWEREAADAAPDAYQRLITERRDGLRCPVAWWVAGELLMQLAGAPRFRGYGDAANTETELELFSRAANVPVLGLDDLGRARSYRQADEQENLWFLLLNHRYGRRLPVLATSNLGWRELKPVVGEAVRDRLREIATFVPLEGESHRG